MLIGIDVGGTKTKAVLFDEQGRSVKDITLQSAHPMCATDEQIVSILEQCMLDDRSPVVIGYAGYGKSAQMKEHISSLVHEALADRNVVILGDIDTAVYSTLQEKDGITLILGTGSIALYRKGETLERRGGWGYVLGDEGSGYVIGLAILKHFVKQADHRTGKDELYDAVMHHYHLDDPSQLIGRVMDEGKTDRTGIASASVLSSTYAHLPVIREILNEQADQIAEMLSSFGTLPETIVVTGGMIHNTVYMDLLKQRIPQIRIADHPQVYGCYVYGRFHQMI